MLPSYMGSLILSLGLDLSPAIVTHWVLGPGSLPAVPVLPGRHNFPASPVHRWLGASNLRATPAVLRRRWAVQRPSAGASVIPTMFQAVSLDIETQSRSKVTADPWLDARSRVGCLVCSWSAGTTSLCFNRSTSRSLLLPLPWQHHL